MMNENAKKALKLMRSGAIDKITDSLFEPGCGMCALGVMAASYIRENKGKTSLTLCALDDQPSLYEFPEIVEWLGLISPIGEAKRSLIIQGEEISFIPELNDKTDLTLSQIADVIEENEELFFNE